MNDPSRALLASDLDLSVINVEGAKRGLSEWKPMM